METPQNDCEADCYNDCNGDPDCMAMCYYECGQDPEVIACKLTCEELCEGDPDCTENCIKAFCNNVGDPPCGRDCYEDCRDLCEKECNGDPDCIAACIPDCMEDASEELLKKCKLQCLEDCNGDLNCLLSCILACGVDEPDPGNSCEDNAMYLVQQLLMLEPTMTACEVLWYLNEYYYPCEEPGTPVTPVPGHEDIEDDWTDGGGNDVIPDDDLEIEPTPPIWWYHTDHLGSSTYLTDIFGRPSHYYETLPFGEMMVEHNQSLYLGIQYDEAEQYNNPYKFNGKELDDATQMYYYGARYYDPRFSIFVSVDPLAESTMEPYSYVGNNPVMFTDPTGMSAVPPTDFVDINSGKITTINDGIDQTIALDGGAIENMQNLFNIDCDAYNQQLGEYGKSSSNLGLSNSDFMFFAETLYAESSGGFKESLGIVNVLENRASNQGNSIMDQLSDKSPYGVYGVRKTSSGINSDYKYSYMNEMGKPGTEQKRNNVHRAIAVGLSTTTDISNGGMFWDGKDFNGRNKINGGYRARYAPGFLFSSPSHDLWKQGSNKVNGTYKHISTGAVGNTTFSKFYNQGSKWYTIE